MLGIGFCVWFQRLFCSTFSFLEPVFMVVAFQLFVLFALFSACIAIFAHLFCIPKLRPVRWSEVEAPLVSILVPARNEALNIEACVRSLLAQDYPHFQVCVLDDHSTDGTAQIIRRLGLTEENGGLLVGRDLPHGWVGKNWACQQLSCVAKGEYLLFTDADTVHSPEVLGALVASSREHHAVLVSAWPRQEVVSFGEKLVVSLLPFAGIVFYPHLLLSILGRHPELRQLVPAWLRRRLGAANGQVMFFSRSGYDAIGGHEAVRNHLVEDIALARAVASQMKAGLWWVNCDASDLVRCRMYRSFAEVWEGFSKNARAAFEESEAAFWAAGVGQFCVFVLPFIWAGMSWPEANLAWMQIVLILLLRVVATIGIGGAWWSVVLHPIAYMLGMFIALNSWRCSVGPGVRWKGRVYSVEHPLNSTKQNS